MTNSHARTETLVYAGIALAFAAATYAMSVTAERGAEDGSGVRPPASTAIPVGGD